MSPPWVTVMTMSVSAPAAGRIWCPSVVESASAGVMTTVASDSAGSGGHGDFRGFLE